MEITKDYGTPYRATEKASYGSRSGYGATEAEAIANLAENREFDLRNGATY